MNNEVHHQLRESEEGHPKGEALRRQVSGAGVPLGAVREGLVMGGSLNWDLNTRRTSHAEAGGRRPGREVGAMRRQAQVSREAGGTRGKKAKPISRASKVTPGAQLRPPSGRGRGGLSRLVMGPSVAVGATTLATTVSHSRAL